MAEMIAVFVIVVTMVGYSFFKYQKAEDNDYAILVKSTANLQGRVDSFEKKMDGVHNSLELTSEMVKAISEKCFKAEEAVEKMQGHFTQLRETQIDLRDKLSKKTSVVKVMTPVPIEVLKKQVEKPRKTK